MASPAQGNQKLGAATVANAAGAVITRTLLGGWLGLSIGIAVFIVEKSAGWLDGSGWSGAALWALLPLYVAAGVAVVGYAGFWSGTRRAARTILIDTGALRRMVERMLARARKAADARAGAGDAAADADEPPPRGWVGSRVAAIGRGMARTIVDRLGSAAAPEADTGAQVDQIAGELIDDLGLIPSIIGLVLLAATFAVAPIVLA